ncbi:tRNA lysidine(34) synthetase TilS [Maioricimonas sp. JC845]|uniref:tRNA lysidine(34) synthetase TilS n=1 Tax=Maioricimonas sp. JC845 TaxID=3232138 RepID=UPI003457D6F0
MIALLQRALDDLTVADGTVVVGVSGGADSVALLHGLKRLASSHRLRLVAAHLDHGLRGSLSAEDAAWVHRLAGRLGIPIVTDQIDVAARAVAAGKGIEETARDARYRFLQTVAQERGARWIAVAHTADDQAETILHHILRGTGLSGLRGMPAKRTLPSHVVLVRPLLSVSRAELEAYLAEIGQDYREDASNDDPQFTRNRLRHSVLPMLRREGNRKVDEALRRLGAQAAELQSAMETLAVRCLEQAIRDLQPGVARLDRDVLAAQPRHLIREIFVQLWTRQQWPRQPMGFDHWDRLADLVLETGPSAATLPGRCDARRRGRLIVIEHPVGARAVRRSAE